ncbi:CHAD domain-containing protein [Cupriavidus basilensis]
MLRAPSQALSVAGEGCTSSTRHGEHRARIAAKKLRYAAEFFASLFQRKSLDNYRGVLARLQDDLGWGNDMAVAGHLLACLQQADESVSGGAIYARGFLSARLVADRENQRRLWKRFRRTERP